MKYAIAVLAIAACGKAAPPPADDGPSCKAVTSHIAEVMKQGKGEAGRVFDADIAQCEQRKLTKPQRTCLLAATTQEAIASCHAGRKPDTGSGSATGSAR